ncbi:MAG TPA: DUF2069 domain-containing protein [Nevskiaceae bacterium]|nr:DUF2069 domain-containing protein [Nevskiaceae bacterium]
MNVLRVSPARWALRLALLLQAVVVVGLIGWGGWVAGVLWSIPMLLPLPGLLRRRLRAAAWAGYLMIAYFAGLLSEAYTQPSHYVLGAGLGSAALLAFFSLMLFVRWSGRERRLMAPDGAARKES